MNKIDIKTRATELVPVEQLRLNPLNGRDYDRDEGIDDLGVQLRGGQVQALLVFPSEVEGDYTVLDGHRRLLASRRSGISYLQCNILEHAPSREQQLAFIHSSGTTARSLLESELATMVQSALETLDEAATAALYTVPVEKVRARRALAAASGAVKDQVDAGQVDLLDLLKMEAAVEEFAGTDFADKVEEYVAAGQPQYGTFDLDGQVARLRRERDLPAKLEAAQAELAELKAKQVPDAARYSGSWLSTQYIGHEAEKAMSTAEHVAAGHSYELSKSTGDMTWYWKRPSAPSAAPEEVSPEVAAARAAEKAAEEAARASHAVAVDRRGLWIAERFQAKDPLVPLQARVALIRTLIAYVDLYYRDDAKEALARLTGIPVKAEGWKAAIDADLRKRSWSWLAAALELVTAHTSGMTRIDDFGPLDPDSTEARFHALLAGTYGYEPFPEEIEVAEYHAAEAKKRCITCEEREETDDAGRCEECAAEFLAEHCTGCGQVAVGGEGWDGLCGDCADAAEDDEDGEDA